jgi:crotonobetainyl-CoA:carnitine CoA-transferase CaiB-like acyl-CoA transferase
VANGDIVVIADPTHGPVRTIGPIAELTVTPASVGTPAPLVGEHTSAVLAQLADREPAAGRVVGAPGSGRPLDGINVVEFATIIAAPLSVALLADLGARVIRVEVTDGDPYRHLVPGGMTAAKTTAGKESICIDLKTEAGRTIARELALRADVLVHNYRPGVAERLGLGYAALSAENPSLVWVSIAGYGRRSPSANRPATHPCAGAAMGGAGYQAGRALAAPCPSLDDVREMARQLMRANESNPDPNTSVIAASATLLALLARERHGVGQAVYVNMLLANAYANADDALAYEGKPDRPLPDADLHGLGSCYRLYPTKDGWVFFAVTSDSEWQRFCRSVARADLMTDRLGVTVETLAAIFAERTADEWERCLTAAGVACVRADETTPGPFFSHHPQMLDNGFAPLTHHTRFGEHRRWGPIVTVNGGHDAYGPGVLAGEHTDRILGELGYDADAIARLRGANVVASEGFGWP